MTVKVAINGYGTIGKRVADAVRAQDDMEISGVVKSIARNLRLRQAGWDDTSVILSLILLNLAGGTSVEDIDRLEQDAGLRRIMVFAHYIHLPRRERRKREREWLKAEKRGEYKRAFPSTSSIFRYLDRFHNPETEELQMPLLRQAYPSEPLSR